jgi:hypothetical protein
MIFASSRPHMAPAPISSSITDGLDIPDMGWTQIAQVVPRGRLTTSMFESATPFAPRRRARRKDRTKFELVIVTTVLLETASITSYARLRIRPSPLGKGGSYQGMSCWKETLGAFGPWRPDNRGSTRYERGTDGMAFQPAEAQFAGKAKLNRAPPG